ncbi:MAG: hypothetical protein R3E64_06145 [Halioglobus sp.]
MNIYLHIGFPKTGTSAIQSHIFVNQNWFHEQGIFIPQTGYDSGIGHAFLLSSDDFPLSSSITSALGKRETSALEELKQELRSAEQQGYENALISWEGFSICSEQVISQLKDALIGHHVSLLAYVREQSILYESTILQNIESIISISTPAHFIDGTVGESALRRFNFHEIFSIWKHHFSETITIKARIFDKERLKQGNVVLDFLDSIGLEIDDGFQLQSRHINHSLDSRSAAILLIAREAGLQYKGLLQLSKAMSLVSSRNDSGSRTFLVPEERDRIRREYAASNLKLFEEHRPENATPSEITFPFLDSHLASPSEHDSIEYLRYLYSGLSKPELETWQGDLLASVKLARIAGPPNEGWRGPEPTGVWSQGPRSDIAFRLPDIDHGKGPTVVQLTIGGRYFGDNTKTRLLVGGKEEDVSLQNRVLSIAIDDHVRENGIHIALKHQVPQILDKGKPVRHENGISFKLELLSYNFGWES